MTLGFILLKFAMQTQSTKSNNSLGVFVFSTGLHSGDATYNERIGKIELFSKCLNVALGVSVIIAYYMTGPYSFVRYYIFEYGEDSFYLFAPTWFVLHHCIESNNMQNFLFQWLKVSIRLENTIWIFGGMGGPVCWTYTPSGYYFTICKSDHVGCSCSSLETLHTMWLNSISSL